MGRLAFLTTVFVLSVLVGQMTCRCTGAGKCSTKPDNKRIQKRFVGRLVDKWENAISNFLNDVFPDKFSAAISDLEDTILGFANLTGTKDYLQRIANITENLLIFADEIPELADTIARLANRLRANADISDLPDAISNVLDIASSFDDLPYPESKLITVIIEFLRALLGIATGYTDRDEEGPLTTDEDFLPVTEVVPTTRGGVKSQEDVDSSGSTIKPSRRPLQQEFSKASGHIKLNFALFLIVGTFSADL